MTLAEYGAAIAVKAGFDRVFAVMLGKRHGAGRRCCSTGVAWVLTR